MALGEKHAGERTPDFILGDHLRALAPWIGLSENERSARMQKKILAPYERFGPVLLTDGVGFTPLSAELNPLELAYALHEYRKTVASSTRQSGGTPANPIWAADETRVFFPHAEKMSVDHLLYQLLSAMGENGKQPLKMRMVVDTCKYFVLDGYLYGPGIDTLTDLIDHHAPKPGLYVTSHIRKQFTNHELFSSLALTKRVRNKKIYRVRFSGDPVFNEVDKNGAYPLPFSEQFAAVLDRFTENEERHDTLENRYTWNTPVVFVKVVLRKGQLLLDRLLEHTIADYFIRNSAKQCGALVGKSDGALAIATAGTPEAAYEFALRCREALKTQGITVALAIGKGDLLISRIGRLPDGTVVDDVLGRIVNELAKLIKKSSRPDALLIHDSIAGDLNLSSTTQELMIRHGPLELHAYQIA